MPDIILQQHSRGSDDAIGLDASGFLLATSRAACSCFRYRLPSSTSFRTANAGRVFDRRLNPFSIRCISMAGSMKTRWTKPSDASLPEDCSSRARLAERSWSSIVDQCSLGAQASRKHHGRNQLTPLDKEVHASSSHLLVERSWAEHLRFELSRYRKKCVAKCLRLQSPGIASPISCILWIFRDAIPRSVQCNLPRLGLTACTLGWS